jgi:hypothetical protein
MAIKAIKVRRGLFKDKVQFQATENTTATFDTFIGKKQFFMDKGDLITLKVVKDDMWEVGDKAKSLYALITSWNQDKFSWRWC